MRNCSLGKYPAFVGTPVLSLLLAMGACAGDSETSAHKQTREFCFDGGEIALGSGDHYPEERPVRKADVQPFCMDLFEVTVFEFARFVEATGYQTIAETGPKPSDYPDAPDEFFQPGSALFVFPTRSAPGYWTYSSSANWKQPQGIAASMIDGEKHPVTHIALADAQAYATWRGRRLPTEAEWEFAAKSGDNQIAVNGKNSHAANIWEGEFPIFNSEADGHVGTAPVGSYKPDKNGLYDLLGNVWELTADSYAEPDSTGIPRQVIKGGSHLCASNFCARYRPSARQPQDSGMGSSHIGFRTVRDRPEKP